MIKNLTRFVKDTNLQSGVAQQISFSKSPWKSLCIYIITKPMKTIERQNNLEHIQRKMMDYLYGKNIQMTTDFSSETMKMKKKWQNTFRVLAEKNCQLRILDQK